MRLVPPNSDAQKPLSTMKLKLTGDLLLTLVMFWHHLFQSVLNTRVQVMAEYATLSNLVMAPQSLLFAVHESLLAYESLSQKKQQDFSDCAGHGRQSCGRPAQCGSVATVSTVGTAY